MQNYAHGADLGMFVLDVLRYDIEQLDSIVKLLNDDSCVGWRMFWPRDFTAADVMDALPGLIAEKRVDVFELSNDGGELVPVDMSRLNLKGKAASYWFLLTERGRAAWDAWEPPTEE